MARASDRWKLHLLGCSSKRGTADLIRTDSELFDRLPTGERSGYGADAANPMYLRQLEMGPHPDLVGGPPNARSSRHSECLSLFEEGRAG